MASYVPWYGKKREQLAKHEHELMLFLQKGTEMSKVLKAAEIVRAAEVRALKARIAQLPASEKSAGTIVDLEHEIQVWMQLPVAAIIEKYRMRKA